MKWVWAQLLVMMLLIGVTGGERTLSYFFDYEGSNGNTFAATNLDQAIAGQPIDGLLCNLTDEVSTILYTTNVGALDFSYGFSVDNTSGTLCAGLEATLSTGSTTLYTGSLTALDAADLVLFAEAEEEFLLELRFLPGAIESGTCQFDTAWFAEQLEGVESLGFNDSETITHFVSGSATGNGAGCVPDGGDRVYLHLSKAISGEMLGYDLSDFSYRVTGNGIDVIVPHDHTVALPVGTYTIEELVPDDFVKEDWRIGWYGECERGDTFTTTVTIDEGNVDHGTLYCQADNQYRPDQRERETPAPTPPASASSEQERDTRSNNRPERDRRGSAQTNDVQTETVLTEPDIESEQVEPEVIETEGEPEPEPQVEPEPESVTDPEPTESSEAV